MIKREHIKQAVDEIALRSPEIGYSLDELLGVGRIDALPPERGITENGDFRFLFNDEVLTVRRFAFINYGIPPVEQQLLIKYGEMQKRRELYDPGGGVSYRDAAREVRAAGLRLAVDYEIDLALKKLGDRVTPQKHDSDGAARAQPLMDRLLQLKKEGEGERSLPDNLVGEGTEAPFFQGTVGNDIPALFVMFPYARWALEQAAGLNLEFFHLRFLLNTLIQGDESRLFACVVRGQIVGLIFLGLRERLFYRAIEIVYISTAQGRLPALQSRPLRGVGSFLVAGAWMLWKTRFPSVRELVLHSEVGAIPFYESIGFQARQSFNYVLKAPKAYLLDCIIGLAESCPDLPSKTLYEIADLLRKQLKALAKARHSKGIPAFRKPTLRAVRRSLLSKRHSLLARTAAGTLLRYRAKLSEAVELLRIAAEHSSSNAREKTAGDERPVVVLHDLLFAEHLKGLFHMESTHRVMAVDAALRNPSLAKKWRMVSPRAASAAELAWVHSRSHIERIARSAGKEVVSLDLDTQTTPRSFEIACLAVGGVFNLIDEIWNGDSLRAFAFVRPPGHHAEPDRAMGFCLFNNVALGASYLERVYGLERIMIIDIDAHHGNGTQKIFYDSDTVLYASLHQFPCYPGTGNLGEIGTGRGEGFTVNIPMPRGSVDLDFAQAVHSIIRPVAEEYSPDALLVSCGFDLCQSDRLTRMNATSEGYALMTFFLKEIADEVCDGRLIYVLEGGYHLRCLEECTLRTLQELSGISTLDRDRIERVRLTTPYKTPALRKAIEVHREFWKSLR